MEDAAVPQQFREALTRLDRAGFLDLRRSVEITPVHRAAEPPAVDVAAALLAADPPARVALPVMH
jgi:hypothetical protein